jgi:hypothetical protein
VNFLVSESLKVQVLACGSWRNILKSKKVPHTENGWELLDYVNTVSCVLHLETPKLSKGPPASTTELRIRRF